MIIYWLMLIWMLLTGIMWKFYYRVIIYNNGIYEKRANLVIPLITFGLIIFIIGLRSGIADTGAYITFFNSGPPSSIIEAFTKEVGKDRGFLIFTTFIKLFISNDFHVWLFIIALISGISIMVPLYKYSPLFELSAFLFVASCQFTWMLNGMRQFIAVSILFLCLKLIINKKWLPFILITILLSTIHGSALIMIPFYFIVQSKPWDKKILAIILLFGFFFMFFDNFLSSMSGALESTQYNGYTDTISGISGSSIYRLVIAIIPCILSLIKKDKISKMNDPVLNLCINMSIINACFYLLSTAGGGLFIGRMTIYFDVYNLLLYPLLFSKVYGRRARPFFYYFCIVGFLGYFYYQMVITWNLYYVSDVLNLYIF